LNKKLTEWIEKARNPRDKSFRNSLYIFLICCVISLFIWFLIKMSDEYVAEVSVPVSYQNAPDNKILTQADKHISVRLSAKGSDVISAKYFSTYTPLNINLTQAELKKSRYFDRYYILTEQFKNQFSNRFNFSHTLLGLYPDTLYMSFEEIISKTLPVKARLEISCKPQYQVYDSITVDPAIISIKGPASMIDTLTSVGTEIIQFSNIDHSIETSARINLPLEDDRVILSHRNIKISIPVEEFTESVIELPVRAVSADPGQHIKTFPETAKVTYKVALRDYARVNPDMFSLTVVYNPEKDRLKNFLKINIAEKPDYVKISRITPDKVEFLIQKP
jgi:hypothetical protein